jgi:hypothetical protein
MSMITTTVLVSMLQHVVGRYSINRSSLSSSTNTIYYNFDANPSLTLTMKLDQCC